MKIVVILGLPLSGKSTHARLVNDDPKFDIPLIETGKFVYKEVEERGLVAIPENIVKVASECKAKSDAYFTEKAMEFVLENHKNKSIIFISGVKARSEVKFLKDKMGDENIILISFHASIQTRHDRLLNEDRKEESSKQDGKSTEDLAMASDISRFNLRDNKELGYGLGELMALADFVINTEDKRWPHHTFENTMTQFKIILTKLTE
ncbi:MAG: AAA family ATPase [Candidatus Heimdallarchaeota archaeon]|nr:AAA family ATPase [Candidatus Heimdallarchaeota archaeon]MDH5647965.1 AAA family ATPase [Candidatus Heimdallarchaeota archaeon]